MVAGVLSGIWATRIPALAARLKLDDSRTGLMVLAWGAGALVCMQVLRMVIGRVGSRAVTRVAGPVNAMSVVLAAIAPSYGTLLAAVAFSGVASGLIDVGMNAQGSTLERRLGRPIMSGLHAVWSAGAVTGGLIGALTALLGVTYSQSVAGTALLCLPVTIAVCPVLVPDSGRPRPGRGRPRKRLPRAVYLIGAIAFAAFMLEGSIADWSGLFLRNSLHASQPVAALGYPLFAIAMVGGRALGDRLRRRFGAHALITWGAAATSGTMALVIAAPTPWMALPAFFLTGAGASTVVPMAMSVSGAAAGPNASIAIAQTSTMGYSGLLLGPVAIGFVSDATSLRGALLIVVVLELIGALLSRRIPPEHTMNPEPEPTAGPEPEPVVA